ncbi:CidA/LrgA family protein [uncultured Anaerococcus sp.]|uniref:CidA/LrgA family protein n=1 Tax=uncultured Anaerococcus sp. TaxID=293428 RepID=UPI002617E229|nr:CidA/LrgA family protein [uncultured Anaerococcus sp.]
MKYLKEFCYLLFFLLLGFVAKKITGLPIPEPVFGMIFLFIALVFKFLKVDDISATSDFLTSILAFTFTPLGVGLMVQFDVIRDNALKILLVMIISCLITMAVTAKVVELVQKVRK